MSNYQKVIELTQAGLTPRQISGELDLTISTVRVYLSKARADGEVLPYQNPGAKYSLRAIGLTPDESKRFGREASRRNMRSIDLAAALLRTIIRENLYDAVIGHDDT